MRCSQPQEAQSSSQQTKAAMQSERGGHQLNGLLWPHSLARLSQGRGTWHHVFHHHLPALSEWMTLSMKCCSHACHGARNWTHNWQMMSVGRPRACSYCLWNRGKLLSSYSSSSYLTVCFANPPIRVLLLQCIIMFIASTTWEIFPDTMPVLRVCFFIIWNVKKTKKKHNKIKKNSYAVTAGKKEPSCHIYNFFYHLFGWLLRYLKPHVAGLIKWQKQTHYSSRRQQHTQKKQLSISCGRRKPLSVIYSPELEATGHVCTEWIMLVLCDSELNGYLCRSAPWSLLMTSRWSSSIFKSPLSTRGAVVMSVSVVGANEISPRRIESERERGPVATAAASEREIQPDTSHRCTLWYACEHLWESLMIQRVWKIAYSYFFIFLFFFHSP